MPQLLTIAVPTYNRADHLARQLAWLTRAVRGIEQWCDVHISDNASTDDTAAVIADWERAFPAPVRVTRQPRNVGAVRNIASCITEALGRWVWTVGDDDRIDDDAARYVVDALRADERLDLVLLNFQSRDVRDDRVLFPRCFDVEQDTTVDRGDALFEQLLRPEDPARWGGLALTTAVVYRADRARQAFAAWPAGLDNLMVQLYVTASCARGRTHVTSRPMLECAAGTHHFMDDDRVFLQFVAADYAEVFAKLPELGYAPVLCHRKVREQPRFWSRRLLARCARQHPVSTARTLSGYAASLWRSRPAATAPPSGARAGGRRRVSRSGI